MRRGAIAAMALAGVLVVAACSSSSKPSASSSGSTTSSGGASGTPYVIGNIGNYSGPYAADSIGGRDAIDAWAKYTNAHGGINGHPVRVIIKDDQTSSSTALTELKELIQQDHIIALVGSLTITEAGWIPFMASQGLPVIGDDLANPATVTYHNFYPEGATQGTEYFYGLPRVAALNGKKTFGSIYCSEGVVCMQIANSEKQQAGRAGIKFLFSTAAAAASTSYTAQCLEAKNSNAQAVVLLLGEQIASRVAAACEQQGYHPQFLQGGNGFTQGEVSDASLAGVLGPVPDFPWFASDTPAMQQFQSAMRQYEPQDFTTNNTYGYSEGSALAWSSAKIFEAAAKNLPSGNVTGQDVMNALGNLPKNDTFGGLTPPITYAKNGPQPSVNCFFVIQLVNHRYSALDGDHPMCAS